MFSPILCLTIFISVQVIKCDVPVLIENRPATTTVHHVDHVAPVVKFTPIPIVSEAVKTKTVVSHVPAATKTYVAPVVKGRVAVKTFRPLPPPPVTNQIYEEVIHSGAAEPYDFNYNYNDDYGTNQHRTETGDANRVVRGSYGYTDPNGLYRLVEYVADHNGFRATIKTNEPGLVEGVGAPADITLAAEEPPTKVRDLIRGYNSYNPSRYSSHDTNRLQAARSTVSAQYVPFRSTEQPARFAPSRDLYGSPSTLSPTFSTYPAPVPRFSRSYSSFDSRRRA